MTNFPSADWYLDQLQPIVDQQTRALYQRYASPKPLQLINEKIELLWRFWNFHPMKLSSGNGISLVAFVPEQSGLHFSLNYLSGLLSYTKAAQNDKLIFIPPNRWHMTIAGVETGYNGPIESSLVQKTERVFEEFIEKINAQEFIINDFPATVVFGTDRYISNKGRIGINGYPMHSSLLEFRKRLAVILGKEVLKPDTCYINLATIIKPLTQDELTDIYEAIDFWRRKNQICGWLNLNALSLVYHSDDHLIQCWKPDLVKKVNETPEQKITSAFRDLIGLPEQKLSQILPGRRDSKYDPIFHKALPFAGLSVIHNISEEEAAKLRLKPIAEELDSILQNCGLPHLFAFVDYASFHATIFDLINEPETRAIFSDPSKNMNNYEYTTIRDQIKEATTEFLLNGNGMDYPPPVFTALVRITGIEMFPPGVIKFGLKFVDPEDATTFKVFREKLQAYLSQTVGPGYTMIRNKIGSLASHLTIGYTMHSIADHQILLLHDILNNLNSKFQPPNEYANITFNLSQGVLTAFSNMDNYFPLEIKQ